MVPHPRHVGLQTYSCLLLPAGRLCCFSRELQPIGLNSWQFRRKSAISMSESSICVGLETRSIKEELTVAMLDAPQGMWSSQLVDHETQVGNCVKNDDGSNKTMATQYERAISTIATWTSRSVCRTQAVSCCRVSRTDSPGLTLTLASAAYLYLLGGTQVPDKAGYGSGRRSPTLQTFGSSLGQARKSGSTKIKTSLRSRLTRHRTLARPQLSPRNSPRSR